MGVGVKFVVVEMLSGTLCNVPDAVINMQTQSRCSSDSRHTHGNAVWVWAIWPKEQKERVGTWVVSMSIALGWWVSDVPDWAFGSSLTRT